MGDWTEQAACRGKNSDPWFVDNARQNDEAFRTCAGCPVKKLCLEGAMERGEKFGIWGGRKMGQLERDDYAPAPWQIVERRRRSA